MKLVMVVSGDGYVATGPDDRMTWTGRYDKWAFRLLTSVGSAPLAVGRRTALVMPDLVGRSLYVLSKSGLGHGDLGAYHSRYPGGWLIGGLTVAQEATALGVLDEVHLCTATNVTLNAGIPWDPGILLGMYLSMRTELEGTSVQTYRRA